MIFDRERCPECDGKDTEAVHTAWMRDAVEQTRICNDCPTQYTVSMGDPVVINVEKAN